MNNKYYSLILVALLSISVNKAYSQKEANNGSNKRLALEIPFSLTKSFILIEAQLAKYVDVKEELSTDIGLGFRYSVTDNLSLQLGYHFWALPLNPTYEATAIDENNNEIAIQVIEDSKLKNSSIYFRLNYEAEHAFIGGGFNIGLSNNYRTSLSFYDESETILFSESGTQSLITDEFDNQSHFEIIGGFKIKTNTILEVKPFIKASIPLQPVYDSNSPTNTAYDMFAVLMNFGLIIDIGLL